GSFAMSSISRKLTAAVVVAVLVLGWATAAHAQDTPAASQYGGPTETGESAINQALDPSGYTDTGANAGGSSLTGVTEASGVLEAGATGGSGLTGVLPSTGGPLLPLVLLGGLALSSAGLLLARRNSRQ
ncbi:MAG: hypothetical protein M3338_07020, partial [Actinomycetota bacterium]|nr:hypothetical protein [Actinomycetota bacterium]